jgi:hypothetical protein
MSQPQTTDGREVDLMAVPPTFVMTGLSQQVRPRGVPANQARPPRLDAQRPLGVPLCLAARFKPEGNGVVRLSSKASPRQTERGCREIGGFHPQNEQELRALRESMQCDGMAWIRYRIGWLQRPNVLCHAVVTAGHYRVDNTVSLR